MKKNKLKLGLFTVLSAGMIMFTSITPGYAQEKEGNLTAEATVANLASVDRIEGKSRYDTAIQVSKSGWNSANTVVLVRGDDFADALTSVPLAYKLGGPILLTHSKKLLAETLKEMKRLGAKKVVIVGGELAINSNVEAEIRKEGMQVSRIAGGNRFETAVLVADMVNPDPPAAIIANGFNFPDALTAAPYAAEAGVPILLTQTNVIPAATKAKLKEYDDRVLSVMGGPLVVSKKVWDQIPVPKNRIAGQNRYETNIIMADAIEVDNPHMFVATGKNFADALTGAVLAAKHKSGLLLVEENNVPNVVSDYIQRKDLTKLTIFGGEIAVSKKVSKELGELLQ